MIVTALLEQPCNKSDNINKVVPIADLNSEGCNSCLVKLDLCADVKNSGYFPFSTPPSEGD